MNLEDMRLKNYWSLSGGQRQRALVARALVRRPKLLIADEATKDLDLSTTIALMQSLNDLNRKENLTVLFITHDLALAARFCTHTALFIDGCVRTGTCQAVLNSEDLERAYGVPVWVHQDPTGALQRPYPRRRGHLHDSKLSLLLGAFLSELFDRLADQPSALHHWRSRSGPGSNLHRRCRFPGINPWDRSDHVGIRCVSLRTVFMVSIRRLFHPPWQ